MSAKNSRERRDKTLISGYIRKETSKWNHIIIPSDIMELFFSWYHIIDLFVVAYEMNDKWDIWDEKTMHNEHNIKSNKYGKYILCKPNTTTTALYAFGKKLIPKKGITIWKCT